MKTDTHRKAIVRALINGLRHQEEDSKSHVSSLHVELAFVDGNDSKFETYQHKRGVTTCSVTGLTFVDELSEQCTTWSNQGPLWMGLWLDCEVVLHDGKHPVSYDILPLPKSMDRCHGNTLFPKWLAEVLNEYDMGIEEEDIY